MKKLIIILIMVFSIHISVNAVTLIVTLESGDDELLNKDDWQIIDNNVNWNQTGRYDVEYYDLINKSYDNLDVIVTNKDILKEGFTEFNFEQSLSTKVNIKDILFISTNEYFLYGSIDTGFYPYQSLYESEFAYIAFIKNGSLIWERRINDLQYGMINHATVTTKGVAFIGDYDSNNESRNIFIVEYNLFGDMLFYKEFSGSNDDFGYKIFFEENCFYFVGISYSVNGDFWFLKNANLKIIVGSFSIRDKTYILNAFGNNEDDIYKDATFLNGNIYLYMQLIGDGYLISNNYFNVYDVIISIDDRVEYSSYISLLSYNLNGYIKIDTFKGNIAITCSNYNSNRYVFLIFNDDLQYIKNETFTIGPGLNVVDYKFISNSEKLILISLVQDQDDNEHTVISYINPDYTIYAHEKLSNGKNYYKLLNVFQDDANRIIFGYWMISQNSLDIYSFMKIQYYERKMVTANYIFYEGILSVNGKVIPYSLYKNTVIGNLFGEYSNIYCYENKNIQAYLEQDIYYLPKINVVNKQFYDIGHKLEFNGRGFLNDTEIRSGYKVDETGKYILEVTGVNGEKEIIIFNIAHLSENSTYIIDNKTPNIEIVEPSSEKNPTENLINLTNNLLAKEEIPMDFVIIVFVILAGLLIGLVVPKNLIRKLLNKKVKNYV